VTLHERLRRLLEALPPDGSVTLPASRLSEWLEEDALPVMAPDLKVVPGEPEVEPAPETWRERIWRVPSETRLGVREVAEAVGRSKSWVYKRTQAAAEDPIPHRKLDGELMFAAGEVRAWIRAREDVLVAGPMEAPTRRAS
jgi:predicted DNA-binding transcriptional regulator AlpA